MNNPAIKRLARELKEVQQFKNDDDESCIEAAPLKVPKSRAIVNLFPIYRMTCLSGISL